MRIVAGRFRGGRLASPEDRTVRPTSDRLRERLFNILMARDDCALDGAVVADLFAGTGALGLEALSRGAAKAYFVEQNPAALRTLKINVARFSEPGQAVILPKDATSLGAIPQKCDLVFCDPPYKRGLANACLRTLAEQKWVADEGLVIIEEAKNIQFELPNNFLVVDVRHQGKSQLTLIKNSTSEL